MNELFNISDLDGELDDFPLISDGDYSLRVETGVEDDSEKSFELIMDRKTDIYTDKYLNNSRIFLKLISEHYNFFGVSKNGKECQIFSIKRNQTNLNSFDILITTKRV